MLYHLKKDCLVIDLLDNAGRHSLVSISDLDPKLKRRVELERAVGRDTGDKIRVNRALAVQILGVEEKETFDPTAFY